MQTLIKEYGNSIISGVTFVLILALVFSGIGLFMLAGQMTGVIDSGTIKAEAEEGEKTLYDRLSVHADNIAMEDMYIGLYQKIYYERDGGRLICLKGGSAKRVHISSVFLLRENDRHSDGYEVTDQVVHEDMSGNDSYLEFCLPGTYRIVTSVTDSNSIVSSYQVFVFVDKRRGKG
ncbi:MAG: hypothetical protein ACI4CS_04050 [Candidatus Weimeria sp.]